MHTPNLHFRYITIILLFTLCTLQSTNAQETSHKDNFYRYYSALSLHQEGDTTEALSILTDLFGNTEFGDLYHIYNLLDDAMTANDTNMFNTLIKSSVRKGAEIEELKKFVGHERFGARQEYVDLITSELVTADSIYYHSGLDSFLITALIQLEKADQLFRDNEYPNEDFDEYRIYTDSLNFLALKKLIDIEGGKLPPYRKIGNDGSSALSTILVHLYIDMISEIFPAIVSTIHQGEFFDAETVLYQIDRNHVGDGTFYRYDKDTGHLKSFGMNKFLHKKLGHYQYYGSMDISDMKTRTNNFWPFHPDVDHKIQQEMYDVLYLLPPFTSPLKSHIQKRTDQEFIDLLLNQE